MRQSRHVSLIMTSLGLALVSLCINSIAYASSSKAPSVRVEVNGRSYSAISVGGDETYIEWTALQVFKTPYEYLGNGQFAVTGGTMQGIIYKGNTYIPWSDTAPKVKATKLQGGGFNFTSVPVHHDYHIEINTNNEPAGTAVSGESPAPLILMVMDGNNPVPRQMIKIQLSGSGFFSGYSNASKMQDYTDQNGTGFYGINDLTAETIHPIVSWTDPTGKVQTTTADITFTSPVSSTTPVPADDNAVTTIPTTTFQDSVLFNVYAGGSQQLFQLDTGAMMPLINKQVANSLHLSNLGDTQVQGVTGQNDAYNSQIPTLTLGGVQFKNVPCMVDPSYTGPSLLGYQFFTDNGYDLLVSNKHNTIVILK